MGYYEISVICLIHGGTMTALAIDSDELEHVSTLSGLTQDVRDKLDGLPDEHVVAFILPHASKVSAEVITQTFQNVAQLVPLLIEKQQSEALRSIVEALMPKIVPTPSALKEAEMLARARAAVLKSGDWMTAAEIASIAGFSTSNPSAQPSKWKREKSIFAITHNGNDYFPSYGLHPATGYRPVKALSTLLQLFADSKDGWGLAYWFMSPNSFLGGKRPQDLLVTSPERVIDAARDELEGVTHG
jgi:hypothetical protein